MKICATYLTLRKDAKAVFKAFALMFILGFLSNNVMPGYLLDMETDSVEFFEMGEEGEEESKEEKEVDDYLAYVDYVDGSSDEFAGCNENDHRPNNLWSCEISTPPPERV